MPVKDTEATLRLKLAAVKTVRDRQVGFLGVRLGVIARLQELNREVRRYERKLRLLGYEP